MPEVTINIFRTDEAQHRVSQKFQPLIALLALGAVRIARSGRRGALVAGAVAMAVCAAVFCGLSGLLDGIASATAFPLMCLAASVAAAVCALAAKRG